MLGFRVLVKLGEFVRGGLFHRGRESVMITRRDRSLGGREVVVGNVSRGGSGGKIFQNPLELKEFTGEMFKGFSNNWGKRKENKLPDWWPKNTNASASVSVGVLDNEEYQRQANRLIRGFLSLPLFFVVLNCVCIC